MTPGSVPTSATTTPKRKRSQMLAEDLVIPSSVTTEATVEEDEDEHGSDSPRARVTDRFQNLTIDHGNPPGEASGSTGDAEKPLPALVFASIPQYDGPGEAMDEDTDDENGARKRFKAFGPQPDKEDALRVREPASSGPKLSVAISLDRPGTPPLKSTSPRKDKHRRSPTPNPDTCLLAPSTSSSPDFRAALTWQEEEITIYDPDDSDDDGTGINGIGFKPTAAVAYARGMKRKQQLAEYRKREEREARARRVRRRGGMPTPVPEGMKGKERDREAVKKVKGRRVRFMEANNVPAVVGVEGKEGKEG